MKYLLAIFLSILAIACSNSESSYPIETPSNDEISSIVEIEGMIHLESGFTTIGSNDKQYKATEKPSMKVVLDYDFYMGIHEVTCDEYANVAKKAKLKTFNKCENNSLPITDVTYYDAVLFANAKSKQNDYDTAYTYRRALYDSEGHCTNLEGFAFHAEANAFRLPTEAEWVYAATQAWNTKNSWNNSNSNYKTHDVCSMGTDSAGFCDMAGNALEWVNDWMGAFRDTTVANYAGAPNGGDTDERIVKGGSYSSSQNDLNPYSRGGVYTVTSATRAEYVGFRLAFGSIPNVLWMNDEGMSVTSIVTSLVGPETIKDLAGTYSVKLAFRNDVTENISYLDYRNGSLSIKEITKGINAYHPEISPDGNWIAYCTGFEGVAGKSEIYVQSLDKEEPVQVKLKAKSAAIPRWRVLENGDTVITYVDDAGNNKDEAAFKDNSTWQVKFANGKFGTPQKLFNGAYHGGISEDLSFAVSGARILRARIAKKDVVWYDSAQACNASLSQDGTKRTAFLDFAGKPGKKFTGENYDTHERVFIADSTGKLIQSIKAPSGYTFDHTEWASDGEKSVIVATLTNSNGAHTKIAIIDPADSSITEIAEGDELWHPNLWIKKKIKPTLSDSITQPESKFELNLDSAGIYYTSSASDKALIMRYKMELLWQYKDSSNTIILGSSRPKNSLIPKSLSSNFHATNLACSYFSINESHFLFKNYVLSHVKNLKYLVVSLDIDMWWKKYNSNKNFFYKDYLKIPGYVYDKNHNFWKDSVPHNLYEITTESIGSNYYATMFRDSRGYQKFENSIGWEDDPPLLHDSTWMQDTLSLYEDSFNLLKEIITTSNEKGIYVIGIIFPQSPSYKNTGAYGCYGLQRSLAPHVLDDLNNLTKEYPNFILMDENKMGDHDYTDEMARDRDHLSHLGALQITHRLDSLLRTLE